MRVTGIVDSFFLRGAPVLRWSVRFVAATVLFGCGRDWTDLSSLIDAGGADADAGHAVIDKPTVTVTTAASDGGVACSDTNCVGCCRGDVCFSGRDDSTCGLRGAECRACLSPATCVHTSTEEGGSCITPPPPPPFHCDASTCPAGCCEGNVCLVGTEDKECGMGGAACQHCLATLLACSPLSRSCVPPECGNGRREALEACDDNNKLSGDGCRADCVLENAQVPVFKDFSTETIASEMVSIWAIAATPSGQIYFEDARIPTVQIHRLSSNGTLTKNVVPNLRITYPSFSLVAVNEDLVIGGVLEIAGVRSSDLYTWRRATGVTNLLYTEVTPIHLISHAATGLDLAHTFYLNQYTTVRRVTSATTTVPYGAVSGMRMQFNPLGALVVLQDAALRVEDGAGQFPTLYKFISTNGPGAGEFLSAFTMDGEGTYYIGCSGVSGYTVYGSCLEAAVWAVDRTGSVVRPFVSSGGDRVSSMTWDPKLNRLLVVVGTNLYFSKILSVPLAR